MTSAGIANLTFGLTPYSGDQFLSASRTARSANLLSLLDGDGMIYTSAGHNLASQFQAHQLHAHVASERGEASFTCAPVISGTQLRIPPGRVYLDGEGFGLYGPGAGGVQTFDLSTLPAGRYAVVLESWHALVGVTTYQRAATPAFFAGVQSGENKPSMTEFYRAGNLDAAERVSDQPLITGTLETQRAVQRQYRLRLLPDATLVGVICTAAAPADRAGTRYAGAGRVVSAVSPQSATSSDVALDRTFVACKLAIVTVADTGSRVELNAPHLYSVATGLGQSPICLVPTAREYHGFIAGEVSRLDVADAAIGARVLALESRSDHGVYTATAQGVLRSTLQRIFFTSEVRDALGWHDSTSVSQRLTLDFEGSVQVICHASWAAGGVSGSLDGSRGLSLLLNGAEQGISVTTPALGAEAASVQLTAEVDVVPGSVLEIGALHSSATPDLTLTAARLTLRRTR